MSNMFKKEWFVVSLGLVLGVLVFIGVKTFSNVESKNFNLWNGAMNIEYFESESKDFEAKCDSMLKTYDSDQSNQQCLTLLNGYEAKRGEALGYKPKTEVLRVVRVASSWKETPSHLMTNVSSGNITVDGNGKKTENYSVVAFDDGTFVKVTTGKMSAVRVGEKVIRKTSIELIRNNSGYDVQEMVTYQPLYQK